jgi:uncharacterized protein YicC (UPF0701 family)
MCITTIKVDENTRDILRALRIPTKCRSYDELIRDMIKEYIKAKNITIHIKIGNE